MIRRCCSPATGWPTRKPSDGFARRSTSICAGTSPSWSMTETVELTEIVPEPGSGRVFEHEVLPGAADATPSGRVRLDGIARLLQDVAYADSFDVGAEDV